MVVVVSGMVRQCGFSFCMKLEDECLDCVFRYSCYLTDEPIGFFFTRLQGRDGGSYACVSCVVVWQIVILHLCHVPLAISCVSLQFFHQLFLRQLLLTCFRSIMCLRLFSLSILLIKCPFGHDLVCNLRYIYIYIQLNLFLYDMLSVTLVL